MATPINDRSPLRRQTRFSLVTKNGRICTHGEVGGRPIIFSINPDETVTLKVKGMRQERTLHILTIFEMATANMVIQAYNEKLKIYKERKEKGLRAVKPKRPALPWSNNFFQILK